MGIPKNTGISGGVSEVQGDEPPAKHQCQGAEGGGRGPGQGHRDRAPEPHVEGRRRSRHRDGREVGRDYRHGEQPNLRPHAFPERHRETVEARQRRERQQAACEPRGSGPVPCGFHLQAGHGRRRPRGRRGDQVLDLLLPRLSQEVRAEVRLLELSERPREREHGAGPGRVLRRLLLQPWPGLLAQVGLAELGHEARFRRAHRHQDVPGELAHMGIVPSQDYTHTRFEKGTWEATTWHPGDSIQAAIGQGFTPRHAAAARKGICSHGQRRRSGHA